MLPIMAITSDPADPRLTYGVDPADGPPAGQAEAEAYLVLHDAVNHAFVRPVRTSYWHTTCGTVTTMTQSIAETYARSPGFYGATLCVTCGRHRPVGADGEFHWVDPANPERRSPSDPKLGT